MVKNLLSKCLENKKFFKIITYLMFSLIIILIITQFILGFDYINKYNIITISASYLAMIICGIIFYNVCIDNQRDEKRIFLYIHSIIILYIELFFNILSRIYLPQTPEILKYIIDSLDLIFNFLLFYSLKEYIFYQCTKKYKTILISFNHFINLLLFLSILLCFINCFTNTIFYYENNILIRNKFYFLVFIMPAFTSFILLMIVNFTNSFSQLEKKGFIYYTLIMLSIAIIQLINKNFSFTTIGFFIASFINYSLIQIYERNELSEKKLKLSKAENDIFMNKIQPHFLFNSLASISALCEIDPLKAQEATNTFAKYLRMNINSISMQKNIPFEKELEYVKNYCWLEQLRFGSKLNIEYNINVSNFEIPPLSVQPLVENAIKHGIMKKENGGTVNISTSETKEYYLIIIQDDGIGFNKNYKKEENDLHIGLKITRERLHLYCNGKLDVTTKEGFGTRITIKIPKV